jgi:hypothetical protein
MWRIGNRVHGKRFMFQAADTFAEAMSHLPLHKIAIGMW